MRLARLAWLLLIPLVPAIQQRIDRRHENAPAGESVLYFQNGAQLRKLAPGFEDLLADFYWLRTVQYFGQQRAFGVSKTYALLEPLIEVTTDLDPKLEVAYRYGALFLCEPWPQGKGDPQAGIRMLEKGVRNLPQSWRLRQDLGYYRYLFLGDAAGGARVLIEAARLPGAPFFLETLAGAILAQGGERHASRMIWQRLYEQAESDFARENARFNLLRLDGLDALDTLNAAVQRYVASHGRPPEGPEELVAAGLQRRLLLDPTGVAFEYDREPGRFRFSRQSRLWWSQT